MIVLKFFFFFVCLSSGRWPPSCKSWPSGLPWRSECLADGAPPRTILQQASAMQPLASRGVEAALGTHSNSIKMIGGAAQLRQSDIAVNVIGFSFIVFLV